ncbi:DNA modification methylase, partial [Campylobacter jejuni]|nr:DNA modification methylase [Campylobacter jejuni]
MKENPSFLKEQIITYLGNKRALLSFLNKGFKVAKKELGKDKFSFCDIFSGSGIVSRFAKSHSNYILANDLEDYSRIINECYLSNLNDDLEKDIKYYYEKLLKNLELKEGFLAKLYAPKDDLNI